MNSLDDALSGLAKSAAIIFIGSMIGKLLSLLGQILIVRSLSPNSFGDLALAYTVVSTLGGLALLGVHEGVTRLMSTGQPSNYRQSVLRSGYIFAFTGSLAISSLLYITRFRLGSFLNSEQLPRLLVFFLPYLTAYALSKVSFGALRAHKRSIAAVISRDLGPRLCTVLLFSLFAYAGEAFAGAILYWVITPVIMALLAGYFLSQEISMTEIVTRLPSRQVTKELWSFSWPLALGASFFLLLSNVDVLMIGYFLDSRSIGLYRAIQPLRQVTTFVLIAFSFLFLPVATEYYNNEQRNMLDQFYSVSTKWIILLTFPPVLVFVLFAPDVVRAFFGSEYIDAAPALAVLTGGLFIRAIGGLNGDMAKAIDLPKIELYSVLIAVLINIILNSVLIPRFGIVGAATGTVIGYISYNIIEAIVIYHTVQIQPISTNSLKPLVPTGLFGFGFSLFASDTIFALPGLVIIGTLFSVVHFFSIVVTRSFSEADLLLLERFEDQIGVNFNRLKSFLHIFL